MTQQAQAEKVTKAVADIEDLRKRVAEIEDLRKSAIKLESLRDQIGMSILHSSEFVAVNSIGLATHLVADKGEANDVSKS